MQHAYLENRERKHYIDNLRSLAILLLFPVHTCMVWNDFGTRFYIWEAENKWLSTLIVMINPWFMPLLFVLAGVSARYAREKRTRRQFAAERAKKLMVPFFVGMVFLVPVQSLYARKFFYHYQGSILEHWSYFFTHVTDFTGYDGAFTPGHLWFLVFLYLISMAGIAAESVFAAFMAAAAKLRKLPAAAVVWAIPLVIGVLYPVGNLGGFSLGKDLILYFAGYVLLSEDQVLERLEEKRAWIFGLSAAGVGLAALLYIKCSYYGDLWVHLIGWITVLALLLLGRRFLDVRTKLLDWLHLAAYPIYLLHQTILVVLAYYVVRGSACTAVKAAVIGSGSFLLTVAAYLVVRYIIFISGWMEHKTRG